MDLHTTILGAGPYGLSVAAHLQADGVPFELLGTPLESWRRFMPEGMILKSERFASNLWDPRRHFTLQRYCRTTGIPYQAVGCPIDIATFLQYADWFRRSTNVQPHDVKVSSIRRARTGFVLNLDDGRELTSSRLVLATGHMAFRRLPHELSSLPEPQVLHSTRIGNIKNYVDRDVIIIGAGQSALETAALLHEAGARVRMLVRRSRIEWNPPSKQRTLLQRIMTPDAGIAEGWRSVAISEFPRLFRWCFAPSKRHRFVANSYGPSGAWWLRSRVEGSIEVCFESRVEAAAITNNRVSIQVTSPSGSREFTADHVIAATGFQVDIDRLKYLDPSLLREIKRERDGIPVLNSSFETSLPNLFIVGVASSPVFGPIMRFMFGAKHAAPILAARLRQCG